MPGDEAHEMLVIRCRLQHGSHERLLVGVLDLAELVAGHDDDRSELDDAVARGQLTIAIDIDELDANAARLALEPAKERLDRRVGRAAELLQRHRRVEPLQQRVAFRH